jgi:hypothetical protein
MSIRSDRYDQELMLLHFDAVSPQPCAEPEVENTLDLPEMPGAC